MLVLTRRRDETIIITTPNGDTITVTVLRLMDDKGKKVRIGIDAPDSYRITRGEHHAK